MCLGSKEFSAFVMDLLDEAAAKGREAGYSEGYNVGLQETDGNSDMYDFVSAMISEYEDFDVANSGDIEILTLEQAHKLLHVLYENLLAKRRETEA